MLVISILSWWYTKGWSYALDRIGVELNKINDFFAVGVLLKTMFAPWKQLSSVATFQTFFQVMIDNAVSRTIGFIIRFSVLLFAAVWAAFITIIGLVLLVLWGFIPLAVFILPILFLMKIGV